MAAAGTYFSCELHMACCSTATVPMKGADKMTGRDTITRDRTAIDRMISGNRALIEEVKSDRSREDEAALKARASLRRAQARIRRAATS